VTAYPPRVTTPSLLDPSATAVLRLPEFRALLISRLSATLGMSALATVLAYFVWELTKDPLSLGLLGLVEAIPALGLILFGGHLADRRDRRTIIAITAALTALGTLVLAGIALDPGRVGLPGILAVVFLVGIAAGFERPALAAFEAQVVPIEFAARGASWMGAVWTGGAVLGPALGGFAIAFLGVPATLVLVSALLGLGTLLILRIGRKPLPAPTPGEGFLSSLGGGVRYVARNQPLLGSMALDLFAVFFGGAIALLPIFASEILAQPGEGPDAAAIRLGFLRAAPTVGALLAMLLTARVAPRRRAGPLLLVCVAGFGVSMVVFGLSTSFWLSMAALFMSGFTDGVSVVIRAIILRVESPEALRGRIASVNYLFIGASNELGALESGVAASLFGVVPSIVGGGIVTLGIVAVVALFLPNLRRLDLGRRMVEGPGATPSDVAAAGGTPGAAP